MKFISVCCEYSGMRRNEMCFYVYANAAECGEMKFISVYAKKLDADTMLYLIEASTLNYTNVAMRRVLSEP